MVMLPGEKHQWPKQYGECWLKKLGFSSAGFLGTLNTALEGKVLEQRSLQFPRRACSHACSPLTSTHTGAVGQGTCSTEPFRMKDPLPVTLFPSLLPLSLPEGACVTSSASWLLREQPEV